MLKTSPGDKKKTLAAFVKILSPDLPVHGLELQLFQILPRLRDRARCSYHSAVGRDLLTLSKSKLLARSNNFRRLRDFLKLVPHPKVGRVPLVGIRGGDGGGAPAEEASRSGRGEPQVVMGGILVLSRVVDGGLCRGPGVVFFRFVE